MKTLPNDPAQGMTKREYFAITVAAGLAITPIGIQCDPHAVADEATQIADALLEMLAAPTIEDAREAERSRD